MKEKSKEQCDKIIKVSDSSTQKPLNELLSYMFPKLNTFYGNTNYGTEWLSNWRKDLRICSPDIFDTYFKFSIPKEELSQGKIESILSLSNDIESFKEAILTINKEGKIIKFFDRFEDYTSEIPENNIGNIIEALLDIGDLLDDGYAGFMKPDTQMSMLRIIYQLITRFESQNKRFEILKNAIMNVDQSIYPIVHEINVQDQEHGKYGFAEKPSKPEAERTVNSEQLNVLENIVCEKLGNVQKKVNY